MSWTHVYPVNDLKPHKTEGFDCPCNPTVEMESMVIIHHSFDARETQEFINEEKGK